MSMHAADTYSPLGNWYFVDRKPLSTGALLFFAAWQTYLQAFFMGLLFFIAGIFVPHSFERKGRRLFLQDRGVRLGLPVLFYMFVLGPVTEYFFAHSWRSTQPTSFAEQWVKHIRSGEFLQENGPLWFCLALLLFSTAYPIFRRGHQLSPRFGAKLGEGLPGTAALVCFGLAMAALTFIVRAVRVPSVFNLPLRDFCQYILMFSAGVTVARKNWLTRFSYVAGMRWMALALSIGFLAWLALVLGGGALRGRAARFSGGWYWQNAAFSLWESLTCVALCYGFLMLFREKCNKQVGFTRFLSENAFSVYMFHPPLTIAAAILLHSLTLNPVIKALVLTILAVSASFFLSAVIFRKIPVFNRIL